MLCLSVSFAFSSSFFKAYAYVPHTLRMHTYLIRYACIPHRYLAIYPPYYGVTDKLAPWRAYLSGVLVVLCVTQVC
jgi:hypothetical protein